MTVLDMVKAALEAGGYDGLFQPGACACLISDLSPGNCLRENCSAGHKVHSKDCKYCKSGDWHIQARKPEGK